MATRALMCKAAPPIEGADVIDEQMRLAGRYYNKLVEIYNQLRADLEAAKKKHIPGLEDAESAFIAAEEEVANIIADIKARNAAAHRKVATKEDRNLLSAAKQKRKKAYDLRKELRQQIKTNVGYQQEVDRIVEEYQGVLIEGSDPERRRGGHFKNARENCGLYPGTYMRVEQAFDAAKQDTIGDMKFKRWDGGGRVGPQVAPPLSIAKFLQGSTVARIEFKPRTGKWRSQRAIIWVRVQSEGPGYRTPVWAKLPIHISPELLPHKNEKIRWVTIVRRQSGWRRKRDPEIPEGRYHPYYEWSVQIVMSDMDDKPIADSGTVAVHLGWRTRGDGTLRYGWLVDDSGRSEELVLPAKIVDQFRLADSFRSERATHFDAARDALVAWLAENPHPDWLREEASTLAAWRSQDRLGRLWYHWSTMRFDGDTEAFEALTAWRRHDAYLDHHERGERSRASQRRRQLYLELATSLRNYNKIVMCDTDYSKLKRRPSADDNEAVNETAKYNSNVVSPGFARQLIRNNGNTVEVSAENITKTCHACGSLQSFDSEAHLTHCCDSCRTTWDQDENAARNILARGWDAQQNMAPARSPDDSDGTQDASVTPARGGMWARRKAQRSQRMAERQRGSQDAT